MPPTRRLGQVDELPTAAEIARATNPAAIPAGFRQVFYYADTARALTRLRDRDREAIRFPHR